MASSDELKEELEELTKEIKKLREQMQGDAPGGGTDAQAAPAATLEQLKEEESAVARMTGAYEKRNRAAKGDNLFNKQKTELLRNQSEQIEKQNENLFKKKDLGKDDIKKLKEEVELLKKQLKQQKKNNAAAKKGSEFWDTHKSHVNDTFNVIQHSFSPSINTLTNAIESMRDPFGALHKAALGIGAAMMNNFIKMTFSLYDMENAFMKTTGANEEFARSLSHTYGQTRELGVSADEVRQSYEQLFNTFTDFTMLSTESREIVGLHSVALGKLGVKSQDFAKLMQLSTKAMGQNAVQASATARSLVAMGQDIGVAPEKMISDFGKVGGELAKLGAQGPRAFKDLAIAAKVTGLEVDKLLKITDQFDTFDGAAEQAGKLNAMLGGNFVNAMDMMMETDPAARFGMIRDALSDAGLEFDNMSYYQRKMYAESLGLSSVAELAQVMSGDTKALTGELGKTSEEYKDMADRARAVQSLQEQFNGLIAAATPLLTPLIDNLRSLVGWMQENQEVVSSVLQAFVAYKSMMMALNVVQAISNVRFLLFAAALAAVAYILYEKQYASNFIDGLWKFVGAAVALMAAMTIMGVIVKKNGVSFGSFAIAALALGAAFYVASMAIDNIADSLLKLGPQAKDLNTTLAIMGATILGLFIALTVMAVKTGGIAVAAVLAFGGAILMMGFGATLAADAFQKLVDVWKEAEPSMLWSMVGVLLALAGAVYAVAISGTTGLVGLLAVAAFVVTLAASFKAMTDSITEARNAMTNMFNSAGALDVGGLQKIAAEFEAISAAMDEVPLLKVVAWTAIMDKVQIEAPATRATAPAAAAAAATPAAAATAGGGTTPANTAAAATANERPYNVTVNVQMDGSTVGTSTVQLLAGKARDAIRGIGG